MNYRDTTLLCTGFSGFIGKSLYLRLAPRGARFVAPVPPSEHPRAPGDALVYEGVVEDYALLEHIFRTHRIDYVLHFAANAIVQRAAAAPRETFETNVRGTWNLLETVRNHGSSVRGVIYASTDKVYGEGGDHPYRETDALDPHNIYDISKACGDMIAQGYCRCYGIPLMVARFCNVYGERDTNYTRIVPRTLRLLHEHRPPVVNMYCGADGQRVPFRRDFIYIEDILDGLELMLDALADGRHVGEVFNFGTERAHDVGEVVRLICREAGADVAPVLCEVSQGELLSQCMSFRKAQRLLSFEPRYPLEEGIARTVRWYQEEAFS
jgi:CDP-glucose 4,6-dehydratase